MIDRRAPRCSSLPPLWPLAPAAFATLRARDRRRGGARRRQARRRRRSRSVWAMFPVLHVSHGVGFAAGLVQYLRKPDWPEEPERISVARKSHLRAV